MAKGSGGQTGAQGPGRVSPSGDKIRIHVDILKDLYGGGSYKNPVAEAGIRELVRLGVVRAYDQNGREYDAHEGPGGRLELKPA